MVSNASGNTCTVNNALGYHPKPLMLPTLQAMLQDIHALLLRLQVTVRKATEYIHKASDILTLLARLRDTYALLADYLYTRTVSKAAGYTCTVSKSTGFTALLAKLQNIH
jgi:hypothetical protein